MNHYKYILGYYLDKLTAYLKKYTATIAYFLEKIGEAGFTGAFVTAALDHKITLAQVELFVAGLVLVAVANKLKK